VLEPGNLADFGGRVVHLDYGSDGVVLDGFTLTGGDAFAGGGLLIANGGSALVANCTVTGNQSNGWVGGVWVTDVDATIRNTTVSYNTSGGSAGIEVNHDFGMTHLYLLSSTVEYNTGGQVGGMSVWGDQASAAVVDAVFVGNSAENGGGLGLWNSASAVVSNTAILSNTSYYAGAGISVREDSSITVYGAQIYANTAQGGEGGGISAASGDVHLLSSWVVGNITESNNGGGISGGEGGSLYVENSIIAGNYSANAGGGLWFSSGGPYAIVNSDVVGNNANGAGGGLAATDGVLVGLTNTLVIVNLGESGIGDRDGSGIGDRGGGGSTFVLNYCDTWGNSPDGTDGVTIVRNDCLGTPPEDGLDPLFAGGTMPDGSGPAYVTAWLAYDYHLQADSPAIDTGTASSAPLHDIEGTLRDVMPDIGAYEWVPLRICLPLVVRDTP
jgi:hypothetical protein